jgi:hypothetical protein
LSFLGWALPAAGLAVGLLVTSPNAHAQIVDPLLLAPRLDGDASNPPRFDRRRKNQERDASRFRALSGQAGTGAGSTGFDSRNLKKTKAKPAQTSTQPAGASTAKPGEVTTANDATAKTQDAKTQDAKTQDANAQDPASPRQLQPGTTRIGGTQAKNPFRPGRPPATPDAETATIATIAPRWRPLPEEKPFDPLGVQAGAFNFLPAFEFVRGYDTNPGRFNVRPYASSWYDIYAPSLLVNSNWDRHAFNADFRGAYTSYDTYHSLDRPSAVGNMNGRIDVTSLSRIDLQGRLIVATDRPGSPFIQADLSRLPIYTTVGGGAGFGQKFNRFEVIVKGDVDTTKYQESHFVTGQTESNADRDYTQYKGTLRTNYELTPGAVPFAELSANKRVHELPIDRWGLQRDSDGWSAKAGTSFEFSRKLTGQIGLGYLEQVYRDPTLPKITGPVIDGSLLWTASALTSARLFALTTISESPLAGQSGLYERTVGLEVNHWFRRWLLGTGTFVHVHDVYAGSVRVDNRYIASAALTYMLNREFQLRGEFRQEWQSSNIPGSNYVASIWLLGLRLQR